MSDSSPTVDSMSADFIIVSPFRVDMTKFPLVSNIVSLDYCCKHKEPEDCCPPCKIVIENITKELAELKSDYAKDMQSQKGIFHLTNPELPETDHSFSEPVAGNLKRMYEFRFQYKNSYYVYARLQSYKRAYCHAVINADSGVSWPTDDEVIGHCTWLSLNGWTRL